jgi:hypothetical protein
MMDTFAQYRKAVSAVLTPVATYAVAKFALDLPPEVIAPAVGLLTGLVVWATPNAVKSSYGTG